MTKEEDNNAEMRDLDLAMRTSLTEAEEQKSKAKPLEEYNAQELQQHFKGSLLLAAVSCSPCLRSLTSYVIADIIIWMSKFVLALTSVLLSEYLLLQ